jgi:uncharacterized protein
MPTTPLTMRPALLPLALWLLGTYLTPMTTAQTFTGDAIVRTARVRADRALAWRAWTSETELATWFGRGARVGLHPGGPYEIYFLMDQPPGSRGGEGNTVLSLQPGRLLAFTWNAPPSFGPLRDVRTFVLLEFTDAPDATVVTLKHYGWREGADWDRVRAYFEHAWTAIMRAFTNHLGQAPEDPQVAHEGRVDYCEFKTPDVAASKTFFSTVFGWRFTDYGPDYTSFQDGRLTGGFQRGEAPASAQPLIVLFSRPLEATEARVVAAGGRITVPIHTFPGGRRFHFRDPAGLELAVWSDRTADGRPISQ